MGANGDGETEWPNVLIELYKDMGANMRHYARLRFAQMTLFVAITGGLAKVAVDLSTRTHVDSALLSAVVDQRVALPQWLLGGGGVLAGIIFWVMEERAADFWHASKKCAEAIEGELPYEQSYKQYRRWKSKKRVSATNATRLLYASVIQSWVLYAFWPFLSGAPTASCRVVASTFWLVTVSFLAPWGYWLYRACTTGRSVEETQKDRCP